MVSLQYTRNSEDKGYYVRGLGLRCIIRVRMGKNVEEDEEAGEI